MNGEGICYPAFLLVETGKSLAFPGPEALFISGRLRPPVGPTAEEVLVDSSGRSWVLHAVSAVGRWGSWKDRLRLWWKRQYRVEYEASEGPAMSLEELKAALLEKADASEASLKADTEVDEHVRTFFLEAWGRAREQLIAAQTFEGVAEAMGPYRLYPDSWFSGRGRSNRAEYVAVLSAAMAMMFVGTLMASLWWPLGLGIHLVVGGVALWLVAAATARRAHDIGRSFWSVLLVLFCVAMLEEGYQSSLRHRGGPYGLLTTAGWALCILGLACWPGTPGENRYDPQPNAGPSL